ncbi:MAG: hypothetical protein WA020_00465, partial [Candidatus Acidiferrales bacterium]
MCDFSAGSAALAALKKIFRRIELKKRIGRKQNRTPARESRCASGRDLKERLDDSHRATAFRTACGSNLAMRRCKVNERMKSEIAMVIRATVLEQANPAKLSLST